MVRWGRSTVGGTPLRRPVVRALALVVVLGSVPLLAGCGDRPWEGPTEDRMDEAVASVDFDSVGGLDCDHRRPGNNVSGRAAIRILGVAGADNAQAVVDAMVAAGFTPNPFDDLSRGMTLSDKSGLLTFGVSIVPEGNRKYGFGHCTSPPEGAVDITVY